VARPELLLLALGLGCVQPPSMPDERPPTDCSPVPATTERVLSPTAEDADGDGVPADADCDDADPDVFPGQWDAAGDGQDEDCDGNDSASLGHAWASFGGPGPFSLNGRVVFGLGDLDSDGLDDVASSSPNALGGAGAVSVLLGSSLVEGGERTFDDAHARFVGGEPGTAAGLAAASAGDVDGDGVGDLLVGAPARDGGRVWLISGAKLVEGGELGPADALVEFAGEAEHDRLGVALAGAGDVDGDGLGDVLLGADGHDGAGAAAGRTYLFRGSDLASGGDRAASAAWASWDGEAAGDFSGHAVAGGGDVDGDGLDDVLVGAHANDEAGRDAGKAYVLFGAGIEPGQHSLADADAHLTGEAEDDFAGWRVSFAGLVDGDCRADVLVSASRSDRGGEDAGAAWLVLGETLAEGGRFAVTEADVALVGPGDAPHELAGWSLASAGDVDADGRADLLVGAMWNDEGGLNAGRSYLVLGRSVAAGADVDLGAADAAFVGTNVFGPTPLLAHDQSGESVASAGDVDGDGRADLLIGAPDANDGAGRLYLLRSPLP